MKKVSFILLAILWISVPHVGGAGPKKLPTPLPGDGTTDEWCDVRSFLDADSGEEFKGTLRERVELYNRIEGRKCFFYVFFIFSDKTIVLNRPLVLENRLRSRDPKDPENPAKKTGTFVSGYGVTEYDGEGKIKKPETLGITLDALKFTSDPTRCAIMLKDGFLAKHEIHGITIKARTAAQAICDEKGKDLMEAVSPYCGGKKGKDCDFHSVEVVVPPPSPKPPFDCGITAKDGGKGNWELSWWAKNFQSLLVTDDQPSTSVVFDINIYYMELGPLFGEELSAAPRTTSLSVTPAKKTTYTLSVSRLVGGVADSCVKKAIADPPTPPPVTPKCGNGIVEKEAGEECEPPNSASCDKDCHVIPPPPPPTATPVCGNGIIEKGEQCEPPNSAGCDKDCRFVPAPPPPPPPPTATPVCGNGIIEKEAGEQCEPPSKGGCDEKCHFVPAPPPPPSPPTPPSPPAPPPTPPSTSTPVCGNGVVEKGEQCEPPNTTGCDKGCRSVAPAPLPSGNPLISGNPITIGTGNGGCSLNPKPFWRGNDDYNRRQQGGYYSE